MKTNYIKFIALLLLIATFTNCSDDDNDTSEVVNLNLKHYLVPVTGLDLQLALLAQEGTDPTLRTFFSNIEGFTYELGFDYELLVRKSEIANPPADGSSIRYELIEIINQSPGSTTETFDLGLRYNLSVGSETFLTGDENTGFELLNTIPIDCTGICNELTVALDPGTTLFGTFTRNSDNVYVLSATTIR